VHVGEKVEGGVITKSLRANLDDLQFAVQSIVEQIDQAGNDALAQHRAVDDVRDLPLPRLEMEWTPSTDPQYSWDIEYRLVYRHFLGHTECVRMGLTKRGGSSTSFSKLLAGDKMQLPFRDGAHFVHDGGHFGMPLFVVTPDGTGRFDTTNDPTRIKGVHARRSSDA
jgi:hypothetical protein